ASAAWARSSSTMPSAGRSLCGYRRSETGPHENRATPPASHPSSLRIGQDASMAFGSDGAALDARERQELCDVLEQLGPSAPTLIEGWTTHALAAHIVLRERDLIAAPCLVLPGAFQRFAERRRAALAARNDFARLVTRIRSGPPPGFFRLRWVRSFPNLNEFF